MEVYQQHCHRNIKVSDYLFGRVYDDKPFTVVVLTIPVVMIDVQFIQQCIDEDDVHRFYCRKEWEQIRNKVLELDHCECQKCKARGKYKRAEIVHHIHHLKDYPELALSIHDEQGNRNLISLCKSCHEEEHPEERHQFQRKEGTFTNEERW